MGGTKSCTLKVEISCTFKLDKKKFQQTSSIFDFFRFSGFKDRGDQDESESEEEVDLNDDEKLLVKFD